MGRSLAQILAPRALAAQAQAFGPEHRLEPPGAKATHSPGPEPSSQELEPSPDAHGLAPRRGCSQSQSASECRQVARGCRDSQPQRWRQRPAWAFAAMGACESLSVCARQAHGGTGEGCQHRERRGGETRPWADGVNVDVDAGVLGREPCAPATWNLRLRRTV